VTQERILVIEDSFETQQLLAELVLQPNGYTHLMAMDGEEGLRMTLEESPDLIVLDMLLPKMNGLDVLKALKQQDVDIPVIFTTVRESVELVVQAFRLGASDYVIKPFDPQEMLEAIQRVLSASTSREERDQEVRQMADINQQLRRQLQELNILYTIGRSVASLRDLDPILNRVVEVAVYLAGAEEGLLLLLDESGSELYLRATKDVDQEAQTMRVPVEDTPAGRVIQTGRPVFLTGDRAKVVTGYLTKALLYVPLRAPDQGTIGVLGVINRESDRTFTERDIFLLSALADYAAVAIENARLFKAVKAEQKKLEAILQEAQVPIIVVDDNLRILLCNDTACRVLSFSHRDQWFQQTIGNVISNPTLLSLLVEASDTHRATWGEVPIEDGRTFNVRISPVSGVGYVLMMHDVTYLKELNRVKSEFITSISHDLRTPLTSIQGYIELLPRAGSLTAQQQEFILRARHSMESIAHLLNTLLDMERLETSDDMEVEPCNLLKIITASVEAYIPIATEKHHELRWEPPDRLSLVPGNPHRLRQVIDHLLNNAIKFTPPEGWISVSARDDDGHVVVQVADNGIGIPTAAQPYIFDKFYRVESSETIGIPGSGLGLAIVKAILDKHKGRIWVESHPGMGSVFTFVLPAMKARSPEPQEQTLSPLSQPTGEDI